MRTRHRLNFKPLRYHRHVGIQSMVYCALLMLLGGCIHSSTLVGTPDPEGPLLPTGHRIAAAGDLCTFGGRPVDLVSAPDGGMVYAKDNRGIVVIDTATWEVAQELPFGDKLGGSMHGIAVNRTGTLLYATTAQKEVYVATIGPDGRATWRDTIVLPGPGGEDASHPTGIALGPDESHAYVCLSRNNEIVRIDLERGVVVDRLATGIAPYDIALSPDGQWAYVSNWGGRHPDGEELSAPSSGTPVVVDERGVAASGTVSIIDLEEFAVVAHIATGLHPSDILLDATGATLYVANANSDTVSAIDTTSRRVIHELSIRPHGDLPFGSAPNGLALHGDGSRLFVANGGNNAVAVVALDGGAAPRVAGFIPTGWYPAGMEWRDGQLYVANVKGLGSRNKPADRKGHGVHDYLGTVNRIPDQALDALEKHTESVATQGRMPQVLAAWERSARRTQPVPVPERLGESSVFDHVVYIIKENRTYDQVLGDLPQGNGDAELCIFPRDITPNHHALAEEFVLLDNFYCNGINSADGHAWATEGNVTDYLEKSFGGFTRSYTWGDDPLSYSSTGFLWDNVLAHGLSFRNYGEMDYAETIPEAATFSDIYADFQAGGGAIRYAQKIGIERLRQFTAPDFPGWNMRIPDVLRARRFLDELDDFEETNTFPNLTMIYLPQDHTSGTQPGLPTPAAHVADNDLALGQVIEGLSQSSFWPRMCIFVIEDDPQAGFDHVDGHRSVCFVVSPYTKRKAVVSDFYNQTAVLHTMARILAIPPMNQLDAMAPLMSQCFTEKPDFRPYTALPNRVPLDQLNPALARLDDGEKAWALASLAQDLSQVDGGDDDTLNRILWHALKGVDTPYPVRFSGAHGTGLAALKLYPGDDNDEDDE